MDLPCRYMRLAAPGEDCTLHDIECQLVAQRLFFNVIMCNLHLLRPMQLCLLQ
jgi:hypothetical protein